jgi:hypothetical protein
MSKLGMKTHSHTIAVLVLGAAMFGCGTAPVLIHEEHTGVGGSGGAGGDGGGTTGAGGGCAGQCAPLGPVEWLGPALLWIGKDGEAPECPPSAPVEGSPMFDNLNAPTVCGACKCDAPSGSCALPTTLTAASSQCPGSAPGAAHTPFDAPAGWDGSCTGVSPIPANLKCNGVICVQSLTIAPLTLTEAPCGVITEPVAEKLPYTWGTVARTCRGIAYGPCASPSEICTPAVAPGFAQCLVQKGDNECPSAYTDRHLLYKGFADTRACTSCACSAPVGGACTSLVSIFKDGSCAPASLVAAISVDATNPTCLDVSPSGQALLSKIATAPVYSPGVCQVSGGEPIGEAAPEEPSTFCCLPSGA